jgi:hypothetical protein
MFDRLSRRWNRKDMKGTRDMKRCRRPRWLPFFMSFVPFMLSLLSLLETVPERRHGWPSRLKQL